MEPPDPNQPSELSRRIERLAKSVNEATKIVIVRYTAFILAGVYLAITVASTTDEQILRGSSLPLPVLGVQLPMLPFYIIAPLFYLFIHADLMVHLCILGDKLSDLESAIVLLEEKDRPEYRRLVDPFPFNQLWLASSVKTRVRLLLRGSVAGLLVAMPLLVFCMVQRQFLPFHNDEVTLVHRLYVLLDFLLVWICWPLLRPQTQALRAVPSRHSAHFLRWINTFAPAIRNWRGRGKDRFDRSVRLVFLSIRRRLPTLRHRLGITLRQFAAPMWMIGLACVTFSWLIADYRAWWTDGLPDGRLRKNLTWLAHPNLIIRGKVLLAKEPSAELLTKLSSDILDGATLKQFQGLDLSGHDLSHADFSGCKLINAKFQKSDLSHAIFDDSDLRGAEFLDHTKSDDDIDSIIDNYRPDGKYREFWDEVHAANLRAAHFNGANLSLADLRGLDLRRAQLVGARLNQANLHWSRLEVADLSNAKLHGANLTDAKLCNARLTYAVLNDALVKSAFFHSAELSFAEVAGADLTRAKTHNCRIASAIGMPAADIATIVCRDIGGRGDLIEFLESASKKRGDSERPWKLVQALYKELRSKGCVEPSEESRCKYCGEGGKALAQRPANAEDQDETCATLNEKVINIVRRYQHRVSTAYANSH